MEKEGWPSRRWGVLVLEDGGLLFQQVQAEVTAPAPCHTTPHHHQVKATAATVQTSITCVFPSSIHYLINQSHLVPPTQSQTLSLNWSQPVLHNQFQPVLTSHTQSHPNSSTLFQPTSPTQLVSISPTQPVRPSHYKLTLRRLRHGRVETVHVVSSIAVVAEEQLILKAEGKAEDNSVSGSGGDTSTGRQLVTPMSPV